MTRGILCHFWEGHKASDFSAFEMSDVISHDILLAVWSELGPVPELDVPPRCLVQSKSSVLSCFQLQALESKLQLKPPASE